MNTLFGLPRTVFALAAIVVAIILVVLVGMIIIGSAAIRALMAPGVKVEGVSLLALLVTIIVLLSAIFVLLLVLLWCCCRHTRGGKDGQLPPNMLPQLLTFLPLLPDIRIAMRDIAIALYAAGKTIEWMHDNVVAGANCVADVANDARDRMRLKSIWFNIDEDVWKPLQEMNPLSVLENNLRRVQSSLNPSGDYPWSPLWSNGTTENLDVAAVGRRLEDAGKLLAKMADDLGAPDVPPELLPAP